MGKGEEKGKGTGISNLQVHPSLSPFFSFLVERKSRSPVPDLFTGLLFLVSFLRSSCPLFALTLPSPWPPPYLPPYPPPGPSIAGESW